MPPQWLELYERYLPAARAIPADEVRRLRINVTLARSNAADGVKTLLDRKDDVATLLPGVSIDQILALEDLGHAFAYATGRAKRAGRVPPVVGDKMTAIGKAHTLRAHLLAQAVVLVNAGVVPADVVGGIRRGKGPIEAAAACVQLAGLFHEYAEPIAKVLTVDIAEVKAADQIGRGLLDTLRPAFARRRKDPVLAAAEDTRNRFWTLFEQTWEHHVWRPGLYFYGARTDEFVPRLVMRTWAKRATKPTETTRTTGATEPTAPTAPPPIEPGKAPTA